MIIIITHKLLPNRLRQCSMRFRKEHHFNFQKLVIFLRNIPHLRDSQWIFLTNFSLPLFSKYLPTKQQNVSSSAKETARQYVDFVHNNIELLRQRLSDEAWVLNLLYSWYDSQMLLLNKWLMERPVIVPIQAAAIKLIFKVCLISNVCPLLLLFSSFLFFFLHPNTCRETHKLIIHLPLSLLL